LQALIALALAIGSATDNVTRELIFVLAFLLGATRSFEMPATQALLPNMVPRAVPAGGGGVGLGHPVGDHRRPGGGRLAVCLRQHLGVWPDRGPVRHRLPADAQPAARQQPLQQGRASLESLLAGIRFIRSRPDILGAISLDLFAVLLGGATALLPVFAKDILLTGAWGLGLLRSAPAVGALLMSLWLARFPVERKVGRSCSPPWACSAWRPSPSACRPRSGSRWRCWWCWARRT
jgi:hypothetical protein